VLAGQADSGLARALIYIPGSCLAGWPGDPVSGAGLPRPEVSWPEEDTNMTKHWMGLVSALVIGAAVAGCGKDNEVATSQTGYRDSNRIENASTKSVESQPAMPAVSNEPVSSEPATDVQVTGSKAPDLLAKVSKETVACGETIDITAQGSSDVVEMILSDGYGTTQALQFDAESSTWRTAYRVPLNMKLDRLGLSIKAKNDDNRWRRVWVFLNLPENSAKADSVSQ
jgi:hypothetical protein